MKSLRTILIPLILFFASGNCHAQALELGDTLLALGQLRTTMTETINTVDSEAANRLKQTQIILDSTIKQLEEVVKTGFNETNNTREKVYSNITNTIGTIQDEISDKGYYAFIGVNSSLVNVARIADGLPFFQVETHIFASEPLRMKSKSLDRLISVYGYFPDVDSKNPAFFEIEGKKIQANQYIGNRLSVEIPSSLIEKGEKFINFEISIPVKKLYFFHWPENFKGRIYIERDQPFTFTITRNIQNPQAWTTLVSERNHIERADSSNTSNIGSKTSIDLFSTLINDNNQYDMSSARFSGMESSLVDGNKPCDCCDPSVARMDSWNESTVSWRLYAPNCAPKHCRWDYFCGGGGTHASINIRPTFLVKRRGVSEEVAATNSSILMGRLSSSLAIPLDDWSSVDIHGEFRDGDEYYSDKIHLTRGLTTKNSRFWEAEVMGQNLVIKTR